LRLYNSRTEKSIANSNLRPLSYAPFVNLSHTVGNLFSTLLLALKSKSLPFVFLYRDGSFFWYIKWVYHSQKKKKKKWVYQTAEIRWKGVAVRSTCLTRDEGEHLFFVFTFSFSVIFPCEKVIFFFFKQ
jgi:hypothetical protein